VSDETTATPVADFGVKAMRAMEDSLVAMIRKGDWLQPDYNSRMKLDMSLVRWLYEQVDRERVKARVLDKIEDHIADKMLASIATELATDVKQVMSNRELREEFRALVREHVKGAIAAVAQPVGAR
jgi:hypothetical protein